MTEIIELLVIEMCCFAGSFSNAPLRRDSTSHFSSISSRNPVFNSNTTANSSVYLDHSPNGTQRGEAPSSPKGSQRGEAPPMSPKASQRSLGYNINPISPRPVDQHFINH